MVSGQLDPLATAACDVARRSIPALAYLYSIFEQKRSAKRPRALASESAPRCVILAGVELPSAPDRVSLLTTPLSIGGQGGARMLGVGARGCTGKYCEGMNEKKETWRLKKKREGEENVRKVRKDKKKGTK